LKKRISLIWLRLDDSPRQWKLFFTPATHDFFFASSNRNIVRSPTMEAADPHFFFDCQYLSPEALKNGWNFFHSNKSKANINCHGEYSTGFLAKQAATHLYGRFRPKASPKGTNKRSIHHKNSKIALHLPPYSGIRLIFFVPISRLEIYNEEKTMLLKRDRHEKQR